MVIENAKRWPPRWLPIPTMTISHEPYMYLASSFAWLELWILKFSICNFWKHRKRQALTRILHLLFTLTILLTGYWLTWQICSSNNITAQTYTLNLWMAILLHRKPRRGFQLPWPDPGTVKCHGEGSSRSNWSRWKWFLSKSLDGFCTLNIQNHYWLQSKVCIAGIS